MSFFDREREKWQRLRAPLADRMRPRTLDEIVGQDHIVGPDSLLRRAARQDQLVSLILYGPPGTGKTTIAEVLAHETKSHFEKLNAVMSGVGDLRRVIGEAEERLGLHQEQTVLFIDEVHRFNKAQQDALLPAVEKGVLTFMGATTENPFFTVINPLISRSRVLEVHPLSECHLQLLLKRALTDDERGLGAYQAEIDDDAKDHLVQVAGGDARVLLNALELAVQTTPPASDKTRRIDLDIIEQALQRRAPNYDRQGDAHYDTISAFIKSMRGSDPDATLYWLARMVEAGEDPRFIARRILIHAAEDVGLANPEALVLATAAAEATERVGFPEARIILAEAALYIALSPKSNSALGIDLALRDVRAGKGGAVPAHLRDAHYDGASALGRGVNYQYPHSHPNGWVAQKYLPDGIDAPGYFSPSNQGREAELVERLQNIRRDPTEKR